MDHVDVGGLRIAFARAGQGPPLVLLHGALADSRVWRRQLDGLADEFTVVAWDAPGCGGSSDPPEEFGMSGYADCLAGFVEALSLDRPHVLGLSFGGALALAFAQRHPAVARTLVLASAYAGWSGSLPPGEVDRRVRRARREAELPPEQWVRDYLPGLLTDAAPAEVADELLTIMLDTRAASMRAMIPAMTVDLRAALPHVRVPTLLLYGEHDVRAPGPVALDLHDRLPDSRLEVLPGAGHECNLEAPHAFNAAVRVFLRSAGTGPVTGGGGALQ